MTTEAKLGLPSFSHRTNLRDQVADALRAAVVTGQMEPGRIYSAPALAVQFGVSATPVREAMLDLVKQGLIEVVRNKGFRVTAVSDDELDQITEIILLLEPPAGAIAARRATIREVSELRPVADAIVEAAANDDLISYIDADREFHAKLLALAGNPRLVRIVRDLRSQTRLYGLAELPRRERLMASAAEHVAMCDHLAAREPAALEALLRTHVGHVRRGVGGAD
ncbi:MAG TPA: GntR family transcriptional regulator [Nocardioidaceae bacterium]|nr:GntR family transcriptional regulator [Nocardioidaceae bacterium]